MKINSDRNEENEPLCRFGPGGDFTFCWPGRDENILNQHQNRLSDLLNTIADIMRTTLISYPKNCESAKEHIPAKKKDLTYATKNEGKIGSANAETATIIKGNFQLQDQPALFSDDRGISITTEHKPKHRIRTYRRTAKKKTTHSLAGQGTLFEDNFKIAKTA